MKKNLMMLFLLCFTYCARGQCTFERFFPYYPAPKNNMLLLKDGGYVSYSAAWKDTVNFGFEESDFVLVKTDSCGNVVWVNDAGYLADGDPDTYTIEMDSGNIMTVGYTAAGLPGSMGNIRVGKYNNNGQLAKEKLIQGGPISAPNGVVKNKTKENSYFIHGYTDNAGTDRSKPLLVEIDRDLNIKKWKELNHPRFSKANYPIGNLVKFIEVDDTSYTAIISAGSVSTDTTFMVHLDTNFNVKHVYSLINDTIFSLVFYSMFLNNDQKLIDCAGVYKRTENSLPKDCMVKLDLEGHVRKIVYFDDSISNIKCMNPTKDGGFILSGSCVFKVDSNFIIEWAKSNRGSGGLFSIEQLSDGGFVGGGICDLHTQSIGFPPYYYEMYLVKMDKDGNYLHTGIKEVGQSSSPSISIYPNPSNTLLTVQSAQKYSTIELWNTTGSLVLKEENASTTIDVSVLPQGLYILRVLGSTQDMIATLKVSVLH